MDVIVTVDTEADDQWSGGRDVRVQNLACVPRFQELCARHRLRPTYLCTYEVGIAPEFDALARYQAEGAAEIGAHLHPWTTPPFDGKAEDGFDAEWYPAFPSELPLASFRRKMETLTTLLRKRTGHAPTSYRSGRWGLAAEHVEPLVELGYIVDTSVTPLKSWEQTRGVKVAGPNYERAPAAPYFLGGRDVLAPGGSRLLELPMTILYTGMILRSSAAARALRLLAVKTRPGRVLSHRLGFDPLWFRPYPELSARALLGVYEAACAARLPYVMMMLHSSELLAGGSPYNPDEAAIEQLYRKLDELFGNLAHDGARGVTLTEAARKASAQRS